jgi:hypothetical protein
MLVQLDAWRTGPDRRSQTSKAVSGNVIVSESRLTADASDTESKRRARAAVGLPDRRIPKQVRRMATAFAQRGGTVLDVEGKPQAVRTIHSGARPHWRSLRRVIRRARSEGCASELIDGTVLYLAIYDLAGLRKGSTDSLMRLPGVSDNIERSGILHGDEIVVHEIPAVQAPPAMPFMPLYVLYSTASDFGFLAWPSRCPGP